MIHSFFGDCMNKCSCSSKKNSRDVLKTKVKNIDNLIKAVVYSNPHSNIHVLYKKDDVMYIYYGNASELVYVEGSNVESGVYIYTNGVLLSTDKMDKVGEIYIIVIDVLETDLLN